MPADPVTGLFDVSRQLLPQGIVLAGPHVVVERLPRILRIAAEQLIFHNAIDGVGFDRLPEEIETLCQGMPGIAASILCVDRSCVGAFHSDLIEDRDLDHPETGSGIGNDLIMVDNTRFMHGRRRALNPETRLIATCFGYRNFAVPDQEEPEDAIWRQPPSQMRFT